MFLKKIKLFDFFLKMKLFYVEYKNQTIIWKNIIEINYIDSFSCAFFPFLNFLVIISVLILKYLRGFFYAYFDDYKYYKSRTLVISI